MSGRILDRHGAVFVQHVADDAGLDVVAGSHDEQCALSLAARYAPCAQVGGGEPISRPDYPLMLTVRNIFCVVFIVGGWCERIAFDCWQRGAESCASSRLRPIACKALSASCPS